MATPISIDDTLTGHPVSLDSTNSNFPGTYYNNNVLENAFTDASSSTRAAPYTNTGSGATTTMYLNFDCSSIPSGSTIKSISCKVKCGTQGTNYFSTRTVQMSSGTTVKGNATTMSGSNSSPQTHTLTVGSWTADELHNAKLKFYIVRGSSNTTTEATFSIYGATLTVSYSYNGYQYTITSSSSVSGITTSPASQDIMGGGEGIVRIDADSLGSAIVKDNGTNVTSSLVRHNAESGGTKSTVLGAYSLTSGGFNGSGASYFSGLVGAGVDHTKTTYNYYSSGSGTIAVFTYNLDFTGIPSNATITRVYCEVNGHAESTSNSNEYMCVQLISGSTNISSELNFKSIGTSNSTQTLEATTIPTLSQLENLQLKCRLGYYGGAINGATAYVTYTVPSGNPYYWTYTISNISADHTVLVTTSGGIQKIYLKVNGNWIEYTTVYKKVNGSWVLQSNLSNVFESGVNYIKG